MCAVRLRVRIELSTIVVEGYLSSEMSEAAKISYNNALLAEAFFGNISAAPKGAKIPCKGNCGKSIKKPKSGYTAFISHIESQHEDTFMDVYADYTKKKPTVHGPMDSFNAARYASPSSKRVIP